LKHFLVTHASIKMTSSSGFIVGLEQVFLACLFAKSRKLDPSFFLEYSISNTQGIAPLQKQLSAASSYYCAGNRVPRQPTTIVQDSPRKPTQTKVKLIATKCAPRVDQGGHNCLCTNKQVGKDRYTRVENRVPKRLPL